MFVTNPLHRCPACGATPRIIQWDQYHIDRSGKRVISYTNYEYSCCADCSSGEYAHKRAAVKEWKRRVANYKRRHHNS